MSTTFIILIGILCIMAGIILWMLRDILKQYRAQLKHIAECRKHHKNKDALAIDYWRMDKSFNLDDHRWWMDKTMRWVPRGNYIEEPYEDLYREGYLKAEKWMPELRYIGIPVFVKLHNFKLCDPRQHFSEISGKPCLITTSVLYNVYKARTLKKAIAGLGKVKLPEMDLKAMAFIIPLILGILIAIFYLMRGHF